MLGAYIVNRLKLSRKITGC